MLFVRAKSFSEKKNNEKFKTALITSFLLLLNVYLLKLSLATSVQKIRFYSLKTHQIFENLLGL